ncbi:MAG: PHP domain-containing protein [Clostridia bacterium]
MQRYENYHKHSHYSNIVTLDVVAKPEDYMKRAKELGHKIYFTTEHGYNGNIYEALTLAEKYDLKVVSGIEAYYVTDRKEKDKSNYHLVLIALNTDGYKDLNYLLSESNVSGFYYKPRIDDELLFSINPNNIVVTTACVAGRLREEQGREEWLLKMKNYFKNNFYLEVQAHPCQAQAEYNKMILYYHNKYNIPIIHANDSHYILPNEAKYRNMFLKAKGINYPEEDNFVLDYPDSDTIIQRYKEQGVLNNNQIQEALNNTLIFDMAEKLDINKEIKLPQIFDNPLNRLKKILNNEWLKERKNIPCEKWTEYLEAIREETQVIEDTNMAAYFVLNYYIIKNAIEKHGGVITKTGRGSAPSFYINKLLGFTNIDRIAAPIKLFPSRFMSTARVLTSRSLADIDYNCADTEPFYDTSKELLGEDGCWWMIAYKPLQTSSAFRLWCKANDLNINDYNSVAIDLAELSKVKKPYSESNYYKNEKWKSLIDDSQYFVGVIESISQHPCSTLLMDKPISKEVGLIKAGDVICANITSYESDNYKFLKNDLLTVSVWALINDTCKLAGIKTPTIAELNSKLDEKTWEIYEQGLTCSVNQADSDYATGLVKAYKPHSVAEMSAFVACIRPGCASLLDGFIHRQYHTTGVKELDELFKDSFQMCLYQETIMSYLIWLGEPEGETYTIIKKIAKKKFKKEELEELKNRLREQWIIKTGSSNNFEENWQVVQDAARYSFNCSHSLAYAYDSIYGAYLKSHYPLEYYTVALNSYQEDFVRTNKLTKELEYFNIKLSNPRFRYSFGEYSCDKKTNTIYKGISSIKGLSKTIGDKLYTLKDKQYNSFLDLLIDCRENNIGISDLTILAKLDYFNEFGKIGKILKCIDLYNELYGKKLIKKDKEYSVKTLYLKEFCTKETEKQYTGFNSYDCLVSLFSKISDKDIPIKDKIDYQLQYYGYIDVIDKTADKNIWVASSVDIRGNNRIVELYRIFDGAKKQVKVRGKIFNSKPFEKGDLLKISTFDREGKWSKDNETNEWKKSTTEFEDILNNYDIQEVKNNEYIN